MVDHQKILNNFKSYLRNFDGIQGIGSINNGGGDIYFVVNIYSDWFEENFSRLPDIFQGIKIEKRKIKKADFLERVFSFFY